MASRNPLPHLVVLLGTGLAACGETSGPPSARIRLTDLPGALVTGPEATPDEPLLSGFDAGEWHRLTVVERPLEQQEGVLEVSHESGAKSLVRLSGRRGALYRIVPVEPLTCYEFSCDVRTLDLEPATEPFFGATPWLAELTRFGTPEGLLANGIDPWVHERHLFSSAAGEEEPVDRSRMFRTGPETRALVVACVLGMLEEVVAGAVEFSEIRLRKISERTYWETFLAEAVAEWASGEPPLEGLRAERLVKGMIGAEVRPSYVAFPGDVLRFELDVPAGGPVLETGIGPWEQAFVEEDPRAIDFLVRIDGHELRRLPTRSPRKFLDARWGDVTVDLSEWAGERVSLELAVEGGLPGLFGAPVVRNTWTHEDRPNVLLLSIDTLRADHLGCYGYEEDTSPRIDAFAAESIFFRTAVAQAPYTLPSHATMLSGQVPSVHGLQMPGRVLSSARSPILARMLAGQGYRTQAFTGGGFVNADFGFDKGFDGFTNIDPLMHRNAGFFQRLLGQDLVALHRLRRDGEIPERVTRELVDEHGPKRVHTWLRDHADEPFFLFVHTYAVHDYDAPPEYMTCHEKGCTSKRVDYEDVRLTMQMGWNPPEVSAEDKAHLGHAYDAALRYTDEQVGELLDVLDELDLSERTIVLLTSDHGEEIFDRGFMQHGKTLYDELVRVPFIMRIPGEAPRVVTRPAMVVDVAPTLLGRVGAPHDPRMQGADLLADQTPRFLWSEIHDTFVHKYAIQDQAGDWKLIHAPPDPEVAFPSDREWQLYDLRSDPGERHDLAAAREEQLQGLRAALERHREALRLLVEELGDLGEGDLSEETLRQLQELGYAQ